jgi:hypothetical protein
LESGINHWVYSEQVKILLTPQEMTETTSSLPLEALPTMEMEVSQTTPQALSGKIAQWAQETPPAREQLPPPIL